LLRCWIAVLIVLGPGCDGFREVNDGGPPSDSTSEQPQHDGVQGHDAEADLPSLNLDGLDLGGKLPAGSCCAKPGDCVSNLCTQAGGPPYCNKVCDPSLDDCPVGFGCDPQMKQCVPPPAGSHQCGPHVVQATNQPTGGCCGKDGDCLSGRCINVGVGDYFCTQPCTRSPDNCPVGLVCSSSGEALCATPTDSTCSYK